MKRKIWSWAFVVVWCALIFFMSNQNGEESSSMSLLVAQILNHALESVFGAHAFAIPQILIRKLAHFTEYFLLGLMLLSGYFNTLYLRRSFLLALLTGTLFAASDEIHQIFIAGRTAAAHDVLIDATGVLCGAMIMLRILAKKKKAVGQV